MNASGHRHVIFVVSDLTLSQNGGDSSGHSVLPVLTISNVEEMNEGTYMCSMMELAGPQLMDSIKLTIVDSIQQLRLHFHCLHFFPWCW